jgi:hypothetical protein
MAIHPKTSPEFPKLLKALRRARKLQRAKSITDVDYAFLAIDTIYRLNFGRKPRGMEHLAEKQILWHRLSDDAIAALSGGMVLDYTADSKNAEELLDHGGVQQLQDIADALRVEGSLDRVESGFVWNDAATNRLVDAKRATDAWHRRFGPLEAWIEDKKRHFPNLSAGVYALITGVIGWLIGHFGK